MGAPWYLKASSLIAAANGVYDTTVVPQQNVICLILIEKILAMQDTNLAKTNICLNYHTGSCEQRTWSG